MTVDPKAGGAGEVTTEPVTPSAPTTPAATPEQEEYRKTQADNVRLRSENEAHRKTQAEWQPKVERLNKLEAERATQPPTAPPPAADQLDVRLQRAADALRQYPDDPAYQDAYENALGRIQQRNYRSAVDRVKPDFDKMPDKYRQRAWEVWAQSQGNLSAADCLASAKGALGPDDAEVEKLRKENDEIKKDLEARKRGVFVSGGSPVLEPKAARTLQNGTAVYSKAEWKKLDTLPSDEKRKLLRAYSEGKVLVQDD